MYFGGVGLNSQVYRIENNDFGNPVVWKNFENGRPGGDFVMNGGKMYISWVINDTNSLYEVTVGQNNEYVSHRNLGILPQDTYGLASELGSLYAVTIDRLYKINLLPNSFNTQLLLENTFSSIGWYGLTAENEARNFITNAFLTQDDAEDNVNPLPVNWQNTVAGGQVIYISILETFTNEKHIIPVNIVVNTPPNFNYISKVQNCAGSEVSNTFDLDEIASQIKINQTDEVHFYATEDDATENFNPLSGIFETVNNSTIIYGRVTNPAIECISSFTTILEVASQPLCNARQTAQVCIDDLSDFSIEVTIESLKEKYDLLASESLYEVKLFMTFDDATNDVNALENTLNITDSNYQLYSNLFYKLTDQSSGCFSICMVDLIMKSFLETERRFEVSIKDFSDNNSIAVLVDDPQNLLFSLDGINYSNNTQFNNLSHGIYNLTVKDTLNCKYSVQSFYILNYPKFFTPNNDGINDTWRVYFSEFENNFTTIIYNRYGKVIKTLGSTEAWDGKYNGADLPSDDYWFLVTRNNGQLYRSHFTLKR